MAQTEDTCGPASLAMALQYQGAKVEAKQLELQTFIPGRKGSLQAEMLAATRRHGFLAYRLRPSLADILKELEAKRPVVVLVNLAFNWYPRWHYAVVTGFDPAERSLIVHSGTEASQKWKLQTFERLWRRGGHWSFVALKPGELPSQPEELRYVQSALDLERTKGLTAAAPAYGAALTQWPDNLIALIGAGNAAYDLGQKQQAARLFRHAASVHPDSITAANNLAQTLFELGETREAEEWAVRAVNRGGGADARSTLRAIQDSRKHSAL